MITTLLGLIMCFGFTFGYVPQLIKLYRTKSSNDISVGQYYLTIFGYLGALFYTISLRLFGFWLILNYLSGILLCVWVIALCKKYKK